MALAYPTAVHSVVDGQATPERRLALAPAGLGLDWIAQLLPFQRSARVRPTPALFVEYPTAVHRVVEGQATPRSRLLVAPLGLGVDWTAQLLPFQRSASVTITPELFV